MAYENSAGIGVFNQYGTRDTGGTIGSETTDGSTRSYSLTLTGESLNTTFMPPVFIPKGSLLKSAILRVDEAFIISAESIVAIGGTDPETNGVVLTEAQLEAVGTKTVSSVAIGTWATASATGTTAAEKVAKAVIGTVTATQGKATLLLEFVNKTKV